MLRNLLLIVLYLIIHFATLHIKNVVFPGSIDIASLNAKKMKAALDQRGISYTGVVEIQDLRDLLKNSGGISYEELESALGLHDDLDDDVSSATHFTSYVNFEEETEEMKNSVWVVHVYDGSSNNLVSHTSWKDIVQKLSRVGIRTGYFDCALNKRFCRMENLRSGQFFLKGSSQIRANGKLEIYTGPITPPDILRWINSKVEKQVDKIYTSKQLQNWLNFDDRRTGTGSEKVKILLLSKLNTIPLFYSVLAVKFSGRVKFGVVSTQTMERRLLVEQQLNIRDDKQTFVVMTPETNYTYGYAKGEYFTFAAMSFFLRTLMPQISDVALFSFVIVQLACCLSFATSRGSLSIRLQQTLWNFIDSNFQLSLFIIAVQEDFLSDQVSSLNATLVQLNLPLKQLNLPFAALCVWLFVLWAKHPNIIKWICMSVLLWLPVFGLFQILHWMNLFPYILALLRRVSLTRLVSSVRVDLLFYSTSRGFVTLVVTFLVYALIVSMISSMLRGSENNIANDLGNTWWLPNALPTVLKCLRCLLRRLGYFHGTPPVGTGQDIDNPGQFDSDQDDNNIYLDDDHMNRDHDSIYQDDDNGDQNDANTEDDQEEDDNNDQDDDNIDQDDENMHVYSDDDSIYLDNDNMDQHDESISPDDDDIHQNDGNINLDDETINQGGNNIFLYDDDTDQDHDSVEQHDDIIYLDDDNMGL